MASGRVLVLGVVVRIELTILDYAADRGSGGWMGKAYSHLDRAGDALDGDAGYFVDMRWREMEVAEWTDSELDDDNHSADGAGCTH